MPLEEKNRLLATAGVIELEGRLDDLLLGRRLGYPKISGFYESVGPVKGCLLF